MNATPSGRMAAAIAVMIGTPLFFSSNLIFGRGVIHEVAPFTLAFIRWGLVFAVMMPFVWRERRAVRALASNNGVLLLVLGFLGMFLCGGVVYIALSMTTATNGTLIYTTSPVMIILLEAAFSGRKIGWREGLGSLIAFGGVCVIVLKGDLAALTGLTFNAGDLLFVAAALAWAGYSLLLRRPVMSTISNITALGVIAGAGTLCLAPFAAAEWLSGSAMPSSVHAWQSIGGIVVFASLLAFAGFQFGVRELGPSLAAIFMYLLPAYGVTLAVLWLGEEFKPFHAAGIALVMGGIILATFPMAWLRRKLAATKA